MARKSLYRVWRPEKFADVVGQEHIVRVLTGEIESGRLSHAYLFCGPRGTGKTSLAKILARAVNCESRNGVESCGKCGICAASAAETLTDIVEIDAASNNGVDSVRELRDRVNLLPSICRYKVYIIDEVHMLSPGAFNALLKTLEEPPAHVIFILATTEPHKLPATVRSRCQRFDFKRIPVPAIAERLKTVCAAEGFKYSPEALIAIARAAEGGMRDALSLLDQCAAYGDVTEENVAETLGGGGSAMVLELVRRISRYDEKGALLALRSLLDSGADTRTLIKDLADVFRRMLWISAGADADPELEPLIKSLGHGSCLRALDILIKKEYEMRQNLRSDIVLETAVLAIMCPEDDDIEAGRALFEKLEARLRKLEENGAAVPPSRESAPEKPEKPPGPRPAPKTVKKAPSENGGDGGLWNAALAALKKEAYFVYTHAKKSAGASVAGNRLEIRYAAADAVAADYMKQPAAQNALLKILEPMDCGITAVSVVLEKTEEKPENPDILEMFSEIEEV